MLYNIKVYRSPNFESRNGFKPIMIVNHITDGEGAQRRNDEHENSAVYNTFMNPACEASSHFVIARDGDITQFVDLRNAAWTQGLHSSGDFAISKSPIVRQMKVNPNLYCISKEFIAYGGAGGDGNITEAQFWAGVWLDKYIQREVQTIWGHTIPLNSTYEIGHFQVDPVYKPNCPGRNFPWQRVYQELAVADGMSFDDYEGRITYVRGGQYKVLQAYAIANEVIYLHELTKGTDGTAEWAKQILNRIHPIMVSHGLMKKPFDPLVSYNDVQNEVLYQYNLAQQKTGAGVWARDQLLKLYPYMLQNGLVPAA